MLPLFEDRVTNTLFLIVPGLFLENFEPTEKYNYQVFVYIGRIFIVTGLFSLLNQNIVELLTTDHIFQLVCANNLLIRYADLNVNSLKSEDYRSFRSIADWLILFAICLLYLPLFNLIL